MKIWGILPRKEVIQMHFEFEFCENRVCVWFVSSKESFMLGELFFVDRDADQRADVQALLAVTLRTLKNPLLVVK